jgi:hypothetical protein
MYVYNIYLHITGDILLGDGRRTHGVAHILRYLADPQRVLKQKDCCNRLVQRKKSTVAIDVAHTLRCLQDPQRVLRGLV